RVALGMDRSLEAVVSMLGILESGGAYVPIDPGAPCERIAWILEETGAPVAVVPSRAAFWADRFAGLRLVVPGLHPRPAGDPPPVPSGDPATRSEERRVGKE